MKHIEVKYQNDSYDIIPDSMLYELIFSGKVKQFYRSSEQRWVTVSSDLIRGTRGSYSGPERRVEDFHKMGTSLEEQLAESVAEADRITTERQREVQEWKQILDNLRDRLTNSKF